MEPELEKIILELIKDDKFKHVKLKKAYIHENYYQLDYVDL